MEYSLKPFFYLDKESKRHRYIQIGRESGKGDFTGLIIDYVGGGEYGNFYFLDGECLNSREDLEEEDDDAFEDEMENVYPGILDEMYDILDMYAVWNEDEGGYDFTEAFTGEFGPFDKPSMIIGEENLNPIVVGNSYFEGWKILEDEPVEPEESFEDVAVEEDEIDEEEEFEEDFEDE